MIDWGNQNKFRKYNGTENSSRANQTYLLALGCKTFVTVLILLCYSKL